MDDGAASMLRFTRLDDDVPFGSEERELAKMLAPHLKRALRLDRELALHQVIHRRYADACDRLGLAAFLLDRSGCVLEKNALAAELLKPADALVLRNGRLAARDPTEDRKLQQAIRETRNGVEANKPGARPVVLSAQRADSGSLGVLVQRITDSETVRTGGRKPTTIVFVRDPEARVGECAEAAQRLFNLTQTEAALVVRLANGLSLIEAAQDMQIRHTTARTHLRSIFAKTGLTRQSSLVRQVLNSVTPLTRDEPGAFEAEGRAQRLT
jgi:DNA-binding CsgD family transcriptional regulator